MVIFSKYVFCMKNHFEGINTTWLDAFKIENSNDISFDLYKDFADSEETLRKYWELFSDFYYISCHPFDESIEKWKDMPEIYNILKRSEHMADGHPLEILIWKYSEESMERAKKNNRGQKKGIWIIRNCCLRTKVLYVYCWIFLRNYW